VKRGERLDLGWDLFEQGELEGAIQAAEALVEEEPDDPEGLILLGSALLEAGRLDEALERLNRAIALDPADIPARLALASALYGTCRFEEALSAIGPVFDAGITDAYPHYLKGLILDMLGRRDEADACFAEASRLEPDRFVVPLSIGEEGFGRAVETALADLPGEFREKIRDVPVVVQDVPGRELIEGLEDGSPDLLGLFVGVPLTEKSHGDLPGAPEAIYLFRRNLERVSASREDLIEEIRVTLLHEIGHFLGMDESDLEEAGYD